FRIVLARENLLNALGAAAARILQHFQGLPNLLETGVVRHAGGGGAAVDPVEEGGQVEQFATGLEKRGVQRLGGGQRRRVHGAALGHSCTGRENKRLWSMLTRVFKLPERKPSRSSVTN